MEKISNLGYLMIGKESSKGTAVVPTVAIPLYSESLFTNQNLDLDNPIMAERHGIYQILQGQRDHQGEISVLAEPKTLPHFLNMMFDKRATTGEEAPYTHPWTLGDAEASYTFDILKGNVVHRYFGVEVRSLSPEFDDNKMKLSLNVSALGHVSIMPISSGSGTTLTLATDYDPEPAKGVHADDTLTLVNVTGGTVDDTEDVAITSINDAKTIITTASMTGTYATGDYCYIKAQVPNPTIGMPFQWARTEFRFGDTAAAALTAAQTRLERGSKFDIVHEFESDEGAKRSGNYDPASLLRKQSSVDVTVKRFLDTGQELQEWIRRTKRALVIRCFGSLISGSTYNEFRITLNNLKIVESPDPLSTGEIVYVNQVLKAQYDTSDQQAFSLTVVNDVAGTSY